jgi:antitoxin YefM
VGDGPEEGARYLLPRGDMETLTTQEAQERLAALIKNASRGQSKYRITSAEGNAVLLSEEAYENILITLEMLSIPMFLENSQDSQSMFL